MGLSWKRSALAELCLALLLCGVSLSLHCPAGAQTTAGAAAIATTSVTDTVYRANGTAAQGTVLISWPAFANANGASVPAGSTAVVIGAKGTVNIALVPNAGSTPMGSYYTVVYHLDDGSVTREYWVVPVSATPVSLASIRSTVLPTSVAMQTVSKSYVDSAIVAAVSGQSTTLPYVMKSGDTMSGPLALPADPTSPLQASDKHYVDLQVAAAGAGLSQKVSTLPQSTQVVVQPAGTALDVNNLNGREYASQYQASAGNNGIANATASPDCTSGCDVVAEQPYRSTEAAQPTTWNNQTRLDDRRGGGSNETFFNPLGGYSQNFARSINLFSTVTAAGEHLRTGAEEMQSTGLVIANNALTGGSNVFPESIEGTVPYFKSTYSALSLVGNNNTPGQHVLVPQTQNCYGVGDCLMGSQFIVSSGGLRDDADEGAHPFDIQLAEDNRVFTATCSTGCTPGATVLQLTALGSGGTQGEGRYLMDTNPAKVISSGVLTGGAPSAGLLPSATFSGTNFPVSVLFQSAQTIPTQVNAIAPGTVTIAIVASGAPAGFSTGTGSLSASNGMACVADLDLSDGKPTNFETTAYQVVDSTHLRLTLNRPHASGATIAVGGLCGYGLEQKVDTFGPLRQVFPVLGSISSSSLLYAGGQSPIVGVSQLTSAYVNVTGLIASIARANGTVTVTLSGALPSDVNGSTLTIANVTDASYNGSFAVTTTSSNTFTYTQAGANSTSAGGTVALITGGYALYPMAEVLSVYNAQTKAIDGQVTLAANTVNWSAGDAVEQPHYFQQAVDADTSYVTQFLPRPSRHQMAGIQYQGPNGPGLRGWVISNYSPYSAYFGNGGTHAVPDNGMEVDGAWQHALDIEAGDQAAISVRCNSHGCNRWNSGYSLFQMTSSTGQDTIGYQPQNSTLNFALRGSTYQFTPQAMTAGTINVSTLNAGTITGTFAGAVKPSSLPVFGASGAAHQVGAVPDPGTSAGTTRFLREDGTWTNVQTNADQFAGDCLGQFNFTDIGAQPAMVDACNGYTGIFPTTNAPIRNGIGYEFLWGQQADFPAQMNNFGTLLMVVNFPVFSVGTNGGDSAHTYAGGTLLGPHSTTDTTGFEWMARSNVTGPGLYGTQTISFKAGIKGYSGPVDGYTGTHVVGLSCAPGQGPKFYLDGMLLLDDSSESSGTFGCDNALANGNYQIGHTSNSADNTSANYFHGTIYAARFTSAASVLTDAQVAQNSALLQTEVVRRGVLFTGSPYITPNPAYMAAGDSITCGFGLAGCGPGAASSLAYPFKLTGLTKTYQVQDFGQSGALVQSQIADIPWIYGPQSKSATGSSIVSLLEGTNNVANGATASSTWDLNVAWLKQEASYGARTLLLGMISRGSGMSCCDVVKNTLAGFMRAGWKSAGAGAFIDLTADPVVGEDGASANTTNFQSDKVHPTAAGQARIALAVSCGINWLDGSTPEQPNPATITTSTYMAGCSDGGLLADATANAVNITLNSAMWQTGRIINVCNVTPSGTNAVTLTAASDAPFNNAVGSTAVTVVPGSCTRLMAMFNGNTASPVEYWRTF
jgi:hypothetical protein